MFPTVFITGLPAGFQAPPSACCVSLALPVFLCLSLCLFVALPVSPNLSFVCLALLLSAGLSVSPHTYSKEVLAKFCFWLLIRWNTDINIPQRTFCLGSTLVETHSSGKQGVKSAWHFSSILSILYVPRQIRWLSMWLTATGDTVVFSVMLSTFYNP